jgi:hypothetical protein
MGNRRKRGSKSESEKKVKSKKRRVGGYCVLLEEVR